MKNCIIWHISDKNSLPEMNFPGFIETKIHNISPAEIGKIDPASAECNIILQNCETSLPDDLVKNKNISAILIFQATLSKKSDNSRIQYLELPIRKNELQYILDIIIKCQYYKSTAQDISESCLSNVGFFEGIFNLAKDEYAESKKESEAYKQLLNYESQLKGYQDNIQKAFEQVLGLKDSELIQLKERLKASEKLDTLRELELKEAIQERVATEKALEYSRIEEMNMDKLIHAQNNLFEYTSRQLKELMEENKKLKEMLGQKKTD